MGATDQGDVLGSLELEADTEQVMQMVGYEVTSPNPNSSSGNITSSGCEMTYAITYGQTVLGVTQHHVYYTWSVPILAAEATLTAARRKRQDAGGMFRLSRIV